MTIEALGAMFAAMKIQYLRMLLRGKALREFETLSGQIGHITNASLNHIILGLGTYLFPVNALSKQKCAMRHKMRKPHKLKTSCYAVRLAEFNEGLALF